MLNKIVIILRNECNIQLTDPLLVGVSGGPDSMCLVHVLSQIGQPVAAMYINHKLRPEADQEEEIVQRFVKDLGVEFFSCAADVPSYAVEHSISIEEAARNLRYKLLFEQAELCGIKAIAVGHNADDQVETILMHLLRGSGLAGLRGMEYRSDHHPWSKNIALIRPFLSTWRDEIQHYLDEQRIQPVFDRSNLDITYFRNRLRHELLPALEKYNPSIRDVFLRMGQVIKDDYSLLQELTDKAWVSTLKDQGLGYLLFSTIAFLKQPLAIQRYLLRKGISYHLPGLNDVSFECIDRAIMLLSGQILGSRTDLIAGIRLINEGEQFWLAMWQADLPSNDFPAIGVEERVILDIPSSHVFNEPWCLEVEPVNDVHMSVIQNEAKVDPFQAWMDISELDLPLIVRSRQPGDQITPLGLNGHSAKISDLMVNLKIPNRVRSTWPLICSGTEIVWMPGYRISHSARIRCDTTRTVHLRLFRKSTT